MKNTIGNRFTYFGIFAIGAVVLITLWPFIFPNTLVPSCTDAIPTAKQAIVKMLIDQKVSTEVRAIVNVEQTGQDVDSGTRVCKGTIVTTTGEGNLLFTVKWQDKSAGTYYVEAQIR